MFTRHLAKASYRIIICLTFFSSATFSADLPALDKVLEWGVIGLRLAQNEVTTLNLSGKSIDPTGAAALALALRTNTSLTSLNLSNNEIGSEGLESIVSALANHPKLKDLNLSGNEIDDEGFSTLADLSRDGCSLVNLNMSQNNLTVNAFIHCASLLGNNKKLKVLNFSSNNIEDVSWAHTGIVSAFALAVSAGKNDKSDPISLHTLLLKKSKLSSSAKLAFALSSSAGVNIEF